MIVAVKLGFTKFLANVVKCTLARPYDQAQGRRGECDKSVITNFSKVLLKKLHLQTSSFS